jgi:hypothetical protein
VTDTTSDKPKMLLPMLFASTSILFMLYVAIISLQNLGQVSDLPEYYASARSILSGHGPDIYDLKALGDLEHELFPDTLAAGRVIGFFIPPFAVPWLVPIGFFPLPAAIYVWKFLLVGALALSFVLLGRHLKLGKVGIIWMFAWLTLTGPVYESLRIDQIAPLLLLALVIAFILLEKRRTIFAALALSVLFLKPQVIVPLLVLLLGLGEYSAVAFTLMWGAIVAMAAFLMLGAKAFYNYKAVMLYATSVETYMATNLSPTFRGQMLLLFPDHRSTVDAISLALLLISLVVIFLIGRCFAGTTRGGRHALVAAMPLGLISALHSHLYDLLLLTPIVVLLAKNFAKIQRVRSLAYLACLSGIPFLVPIYASIHYDYLLKGAKINPLFLSLLLLSVAVIPVMTANQRQLES